MRYQPPHAQIFSGRQTATVCNRLLSSLSAHDFSLLEAQLEPVPLPVRTRLIEPNTPIEHVYFIEEGIASVWQRPPRVAALRLGLSAGRV